MSKSFSWLHDLSSVGGILVGLVVSVVGATMFFGPVLKLYVFGFETNSYFNAEEQCNPDLRFAYMNGRPAKPLGINTPTEFDTLTPEERENKIQKCMDHRTTTEKQSYRRQRQEGMVDGLVALLIGLPVFAFFWRRRNR